MKPEILQGSLMKLEFSLHTLPTFPGIETLMSLIGPEAPRQLLSYVLCIETLVMEWREERSNLNPPPLTCHPAPTGVPPPPTAANDLAFVSSTVSCESSLTWFDHFLCYSLLIHRLQSTTRVRPSRELGCHVFKQSSCACCCWLNPWIMYRPQTAKLAVLIELSGHLSHTFRFQSENLICWKNPVFFGVIIMSKQLSCLERGKILSCLWNIYTPPQRWFKAKKSPRLSVIPVVFRSLRIEGKKCGAGFFYLFIFFRSVQWWRSCTWQVRFEVDLVLSIFVCDFVFRVAQSGGLSLHKRTGSVLPESVQSVWPQRVKRFIDQPKNKNRKERVGCDKACLFGRRTFISCQQVIPDVRIQDSPRLVGVSRRNSCSVLTDQGNQRKVWHLFPIRGQQGVSDSGGGWGIGNRFSRSLVALIHIQTANLLNCGHTMQPRSQNISSSILVTRKVNGSTANTSQLKSARFSLPVWYFFQKWVSMSKKVRKCDLKWGKCQGMWMGSQEWSCIFRATFFKSRCSKIETSGCLGEWRAGNFCILDLSSSVLACCQWIKLKFNDMVCCSSLGEGMSTKNSTPTGNTGLYIFPNFLFAFHSSTFNSRTALVQMCCQNVRWCFCLEFGTFCWNTHTHTVSLAKSAVADWRALFSLWHRFQISACWCSFNVKVQRIDNCFTGFGSTVYQTAACTVLNTAEEIEIQFIMSSKYAQASVFCGTHWLAFDLFSYVYGPSSSDASWFLSDSCRLIWNLSNNSLFFFQLVPVSPERKNRGRSRVCHFLWLYEVGSRFFLARFMFGVVRGGWLTKAFRASNCICLNTNSKGNKWVFRKEILFTRNGHLDPSPHPSRRGPNRRNGEQFCASNCWDSRKSSIVLVLKIQTEKNQKASNSKHDRSRFVRKLQRNKGLICGKRKNFHVVVRSLPAHNRLATRTWYFGFHCRFRKLEWIDWCSGCRFFVWVWLVDVIFNWHVFFNFWNERERIMSVPWSCKDDQNTCLQLVLHEWRGCQRLKLLFFLILAGGVGKSALTIQLIQNQ